MNNRIIALAGVILAGSVAAGCQNESNYDQPGDAMERSTSTQAPAPGNTGGMNDMNGMGTPSDGAASDSSATY